MASLSVAAAHAQEVKQAGTDVPPPKRTKFVAPVYPPEAQASGQRGIVILELVVDVQGKIESVTVVRSVPPFDEAATAAVRQWEYEVTRVDGKPVPVRLTVPITFALRLPTVTRASGIPELRMGAAPGLPPEPWSRSEATVEADVTLDPDGQVTDALVTAGDSPWAEALLQAVRTWRFVGSPGEGPLTFKATARFISSGQGQPRVDLALSDPRRAAAPPADAGAETAAVPSPVPAPASPQVPAAVPPETPATAPPATAAPGTVPPAGSATAPPATAPAAQPPATMPATIPSSPPATTPATTPARPPASGATTPPATRPAAPTTGASQGPPVEVVPPAPPPPPPPEGGGGSAVRGILLGTGVPDLVSGRRPVVPPLARLKTVTGKVKVRFAVDASGATSNAEAEGQEPLREAARQAVGSWIFRRTRADRLRLAAEFDYGAENASATVNLEPEK